MLWLNGKYCKNDGGLGIRGIHIKNTALLFKWWWRYACEEGSLWRRVVNSVHNEDSIALPLGTFTQILGPWKEIRSVATEHQPIYTFCIFPTSENAGGVWLKDKILGRSMDPTCFSKVVVSHSY